MSLSQGSQLSEIERRRRLNEIASENRDARFLEEKGRQESIQAARRALTGEQLRRTSEFFLAAQQSKQLEASERRKGVLSANQQAVAEQNRRVSALAAQASICKQESHEQRLQNVQLVKNLANVEQNRRVQLWNDLAHSQQEEFQERKTNTMLAIQAAEAERKRRMDESILNSHPSPSHPISSLNTPASNASLFDPGSADPSLNPFGSIPLPSLLLTNHAGDSFTNQNPNVLSNFLANNVQTSLPTLSPRPEHAQELRPWPSDLTAARAPWKRKKSTKSSKEKQRRMEMNAMFDMLRSLVENHGHFSLKADKRTILSDAITVIENMSEELMHLRSLTAGMAKANQSPNYTGSNTPNDLLPTSHNTPPTSCCDHCTLKKRSRASSVESNEAKLNPYENPTGMMYGSNAADAPLKYFALSDDDPVSKRHCPGGMNSPSAAISHLSLQPQHDLPTTNLFGTKEAIGFTSLGNPCLGADAFSFSTVDSCVDTTRASDIKPDTPMDFMLNVIRPSSCSVGSYL